MKIRGVRRDGAKKRGHSQAQQLPLWHLEEGGSPSHPEQHFCPPRDEDVSRPLVVAR